MEARGSDRKATERIHVRAEADTRVRKEDLGVGVIASHRQSTVDVCGKRVLVSVVVLRNKNQVGIAVIGKPFVEAITEVMLLSFCEVLGIVAGGLRVAELNAEKGA